MRKYIIKNADGSAQSVMPAIHDTRKKALLTILRYAIKCVEDDKDDRRVWLPVDYRVEEVEEKDISELVPDFESAKEAIGSTEFIFASESFCLLGVKLNRRHIEALKALNQLFTIAQAWNKVDKFVPDFSDYNQAKWFPCFEYNKGTAKFVFDRARYTLLCANAPTQPRLCFMTPERAKQFGEQFIDIYNKVLCNKYGR